jgi:hypothetical protein
MASSDASSVSTEGEEIPIEAKFSLHKFPSCFVNSDKARRFARQKNNTKVLFVMMLIEISTLKNSYFYNEFKNDWNYCNGNMI